MTNLEDRSAQVLINRSWCINNKEVWQVCHIQIWEYWKLARTVLFIAQIPGQSFQQFGSHSVKWTKKLLCYKNWFKTNIILFWSSLVFPDGKTNHWWEFASFYFAVSIFHFYKHILSSNRQDLVPVARVTLAGQSITVYPGIIYFINSLPTSVVYNFCKQFGPRSGQTECQAWSGSKLFDTLMIS